MRTASPYEMVPVEAAIGTILAEAHPLSAETVDGLTAEGRVLAVDVRAPEAVPPGPRSAVDGYAVRADDRGVRSIVPVEIAAGLEPTLTLEAGQAVRIMTGGVVPPGADAVVMVEDSREEDGQVSLLREPETGANIHRRGQDIESGQVVLPAGTVVGPPEVGLLATLGQVRLSVHRRPRVAILATGDELVEPWDQPPAGCLRDSNRYALMTAVREAGGEPVWNGIARDDEAALESRVGDALSNADVLITSGGVSMGTRDLIKPLLERLGTVHFGRVNFKPGKPLTFATVDHKLVFGLPGFPVSSLVTFEVFVRPALLRLQGRRRVFRPRVEVEIEHDLRPDRVRPEYQRAQVRWQSGRLVGRTTGAQGSSRLLSMAGANALLEILPSDHPLPAGQRVPALLTGEVLAPEP